METRRLGRTSLEIPEVGLGTWRYRAGPDLLRSGMDAGAAFIDTAELYRTEPVVGDAVRGRRGEVFIATKTNHWRYSEVLQSADASLRRLRVETIDLYQLHWPYAGVPIEETMSAMERLVDLGKVRFIGVSNFTVPELRRAQACLGKLRIVSNQVRYSLIDRTIETELLPYCQRNGVTVIAYSPLAHDIQAIVRADRSCALNAVSHETGKTVAQIALNWCLINPGVVVIPKTESAAHLAQNCEVSGWRLTEAQARLLEKSVRFDRRGRLAISLRRSVRRARQRVYGRAPGQA